MKMTNKGILRGMLALISALALGGCAMTGTAASGAAPIIQAVVNTGTGFTIEGVPGTENFGEHTRTPVKDFQTVGLVFTEATLTSSDGGDEGEIFIWQALLKEAEARGADAIINVMIDKKIQTHTYLNIRITTWYGSALAIKYTNTLARTESVTTGADGTTTTVTTSVYFNENSGTAAQTPPPSAAAQAPSSSAGGLFRLPIPAPKPAAEPAPASTPASAPAKGLRQ